MRSFIAIIIILMFMSVAVLAQEKSSRSLTNDDFYQPPAPAANSVNQELAGQSGDARPVKQKNSKFNAAEIDFLSVDLMEPVPGHEGPGLFNAKRAPARGAQEYFEIQLYGYQAVATVKFEIADAQGNSLALAHFKDIKGSNNGEQYIGLVDVPSQPFRFVISGYDIFGNSFRRVGKQLWQPGDHIEKSRAIPNLPKETNDRLWKMVDEFDAEYKKEFEKSRREHPDGIIVIPQQGISHVICQPYLSPGKRPIGLRITFDIQSTEDNYNRPDIFIFPNYQEFVKRGTISFNVINSKVAPAPQTVPNSSAQKFLAGIVYHFTIDLIPDFAIANATKTKFCIYYEKFRNAQPGVKKAWEDLLSDGAMVNYQISISTGEFNGEIESFDPPKTFFDNLIQEGAQDCGPLPVNKF